MYYTLANFFNMEEIEEYNMKISLKRYAIIINNQDHIKVEEESNDVQQLRATLERRNFTVKILNNEKHDSILDTVKEEAEKLNNDDQSDIACIALVVMTNGDLENLETANNSYRLENLWKPFTGERCEKLLEKPKIFFIETYETAEKRRIRRDLDYEDTTYERMKTNYYPSFSDFLFVHSHVQGKRKNNESSLFVRTLCRELKTMNNTDLLTQLTHLNSQLRQSAERNHPRVAHVNSTFTKKLYLKKPENTFCTCYHYRVSFDCFCKSTII